MADVLTPEERDAKLIRRLKSLDDFIREKGFHGTTIAEAIDRLTGDRREREPTNVLAAEINALPKRIRDFIHHLESDADPAGDKMKLALQTDLIAQLQAQVAEYEAQPAPGTRTPGTVEVCAEPSCRWLATAKEVATCSWGQKCPIRAGRTAREAKP